MTVSLSGLSNAQSQSSPTWRSQKGLVFGVKAFTAPPLCWKTSESGPQSCPTLCDPMNHSTPGLPVHHQLPEFTKTHIHRVSHLILCHPLLLLPLIPPSIRVFSNESTLLIRWPKYWRLNFSIVLPMNIQDWVSLRLVGSPCSPRNSQESPPTPQFKTSILLYPAFFMVQLSHS